MLLQPHIDIDTARKEHIRMQLKEIERNLDFWRVRILRVKSIPNIMRCEHAIEQSARVRTLLLTMLEGGEK